MTADEIAHCYSQQNMSMTNDSSEVLSGIFSLLLRMPFYVKLFLHFLSFTFLWLALPFIQKSSSKNKNLNAAPPRHFFFHSSSTNDRGANDVLWHICPNLGLYVTKKTASSFV
jgi:hypothetical protein